MTATQHRPGRHAAWAAFLVPAAMIGFSFALTPSPQGFGTHRQLLLPPCFLRLVARVPCPFCGMTTGFAWMARGHVHEAARANLMAPAGFAAAVLMALLGLLGLLSGRDLVPEFLRGKGFPRLLLVLVGVFWIANLALHFGLWHV